LIPAMLTWAGSSLVDRHWNTTTMYGYTGYSMCKL